MSLFYYTAKYSSETVESHRSGVMDCRCLRTNVSTFKMRLKLLIKTIN